MYEASDLHRISNDIGVAGLFFVDFEIMDLDAWLVFQYRYVSNTTLLMHLDANRCIMMYTNACRVPADLYEHMTRKHADCAFSVNMQHNLTEKSFRHRDAMEPSIVRDTHTHIMNMEYNHIYRERERERRI